MRPYCYHLYHVPTGKHYYGVRLSKNIKEGELWTSYFSSSSVVKLLRERYGDDSFIATVRKTFDSKEEVARWEHKFLARINAKERDDWLNQTNAEGMPARKSGWKHYPRNGLKHTEETKRKMRESRRGRQPMLGKTHSAETREKMRQSRLRYLETQRG